MNKLIVTFAEVKIEIEQEAPIGKDIIVGALEALEKYAKPNNIIGPDIITVPQGPFGGGIDSWPPPYPQSGPYTLQGKPTQFPRVTYCVSSDNMPEGSSSSFTSQEAGV